MCVHVCVGYMFWLCVIGLPSIYFPPTTKKKNTVGTACSVCLCVRVRPVY